MVISATIAGLKPIHRGVDDQNDKEKTKKEGKKTNDVFNVESKMPFYVLGARIHTTGSVGRKIHIAGILYLLCK